MRTLPESASLDHLRRQAKELLAVFRRSEPKATLGEAQAALAREYGFTTWSDLKAEVARLRAAPPEVAPDDLVAALVRHFGLGRATSPMRHVEDDWSGHIGELETAIGPKPTKPPALELAAAAGTVVGTLHALALRPPAPVVRWLTYRRSAHDWGRLVERARRARVPWAEALADAAPGFVALDAVRDDSDANDRAIFSNCGVSPDVTRVAGRDQLVVTGWDHAGAIPADWDMANALMSWSETIDGAGAPDPVPGRALLAAYRRRVEVPERLELRMFTAGVSAWLNWTPPG